MAKREMPGDGPYPSNSQTDRERKPKVEKVIDGEALVVSKPLKKKLVSTFLSGDIREIKKFLFSDVIVPAVKDTISEMGRQGLDMLLYGGDRPRSRSNSRKTGNTAYDGYYNSKSSKSPARERSSYHQRSDDIVELSFPDIGEATRVLSDMVDIIADYDSHSVSVADYYDLAGYTSYNFQDNKYGWFDLSGVKPYRIKLPREDWDDPRKPEYGYVLDLPKPEYID